MSRNIDDFFKEKKEWSKIKDDILAFYLKPYFSKIQFTKKPIIYIDGFSGKGKFDDGTLGSPIISYNIANEVNPNLNIKHIFIENKYYKELSFNTKQFLNCEVIAGNYEDNIVDIIKKNSGKNIFAYIDPFGIKDINFTYLKNLNSNMLYSAEFLMNLNSFGFIREGCRLLKTNLSDISIDHDFNLYMDDSQEFKNSNSIFHMNEIAGGDYWQQIIKDHDAKKISGYEAEKKFVEEYCLALKETGKFKYVINVPIRIKPMSPPKYRMVFATNHIDGIILMNDNMCNRFEDLRTLQNGGYSTLFQENSENEIISDNDICKDIISLLDLNYKNYIDLIINYINKYGIMKTSVLNEQLKNLEKSNIISIKRIPEKTQKGKLSKFIKPNKFQKTLIKLQEI